MIVRLASRRDLDDIFHCISKDRPRAADALVDRIVTRVNRLAVPGLRKMGRRGVVEDTRELLEPPYIVGNGRGDEPVHTWPRRNAVGGQVAKVGDVLQGGPGAPGVITGRARIVLDPMDAPDMDPTDVLVAPTTDPSWAPLFLSVGGVVVNVGAVGSHAAIVSRELGVPCAVSVIQATSRIPEGALITVDGSTGTVTIVG